MSATGSEYNFASTLSAVLLPQRYAISGTLGGGFSINLGKDETGRHQITGDINPLGFGLGAATGFAGGKLGDGFDNLIRGGKQGVALQNFFKSATSLYFGAGAAVIGHDPKKKKNEKSDK